MHAIYLNAVLTTALAVAAGGTLIYKLRLPANDRLVWLTLLLALPLQPLVFYLVRLPLDHWLVTHLGRTSATYPWLTSLYAPLTEEPAKLLPLLLPAIYRDIRPANFVRYALAIGLGFAIGEMWFVAERIARSPAFSGVPVYQFTGYVAERLMTCVFHSAFVAVALWRLRRRLVLGFAGAVVLHWLANFPILLMQWDVGGLGKTAWSVIVQCWLLVLFAVCFALLSLVAVGRVVPAGWFYGRRQCPGCHETYQAPLLGVNFGPRRYERCPHCRNWHWTKPAASTRADL
jgi:RsiW-degrading membrane proteinase PrsW (M82 family)